MPHVDSFSVTIDAEQLLAAAAKLDAITGPALNDALIEQVNVATREFDSSARAAMNAGINLSDAYVSSKMAVEPAKGTPSASITAFGPGRPGRAGLTILGHYNPIVITTAAKGPAKGDPSRGVPAGQKAAGVLVEVTRGAPKPIPKAFTMTLRQGTRAGDKVGVFIREGGKVRHLYGVSPYSLFRFQAEKQGPAWDDRLQAAVGAALDSVVAQ